MDKINRITEYDRLVLKAKKGTYYFCTDSRILYRDTSDDISGRRRVNAVIVNTDRERKYSIRPVNGRMYYVVDRNEVWVYDLGWKIKVRSNEATNAYYYDNGYLSSVGNSGSTSDSGDILDNNGLLGDGSVVIRDINRVIRGQLYNDLRSKNLVMSSYIDGGMRFIPNASFSDVGMLELNTVTDEHGNRTGLGKYHGEWNTYGDMYVNSEEPSISPDSLPGPSDRVYTEFETQISHEDVAANNRIYTITSTFKIEVLSATKGKMSVTQVEDRNGNTTELDDQGNLIYTGDGNTINSYTVSVTRTVSGDGKFITYSTTDGQDFIIDVDTRYVTVPDVFSNQENISTNTRRVIHNRVWHTGNFNPSKMDLDPNLVYKAIRDTSLPNPLELNVDKLDGKDAGDFASKNHTHLVGLGDNTSEIPDFNDAVKDRMNLALLNNNSNNVGVSVSKTGDKFTYRVNDFNIRFSDEVSKSTMGSVDIRGLNNSQVSLRIDPEGHDHKYKIPDLDGYDDLMKEINSKLSSSDIVDPPNDGSLADTAFEGKVLRLNKSGALQANITGSSLSASKLSSGRMLKFTSGVSGQGVFDGSKDIEIPINVDPDKHAHKGYVLCANETVGGDKVGVTVAPLDKETRLIPAQYLPASISGAMNYVGRWDASKGLPSTNPSKGQYWIASTAGTVNNHYYAVEDWIVYNGVSWDYIGSSGGSDSDFFAYDRPGTAGSTFTIPFNKAVVTDNTNHAPITSRNSDQLGGRNANQYALINSPNFTGTPTSPTPSDGDNSTKIATTAFVSKIVAGITSGAATLKELDWSLESGGSPSMTLASLQSKIISIFPSTIDTNSSGIYDIKFNNSTGAIAHAYLIISHAVSSESNYFLFYQGVHRSINAGAWNKVWDASNDGSGSGLDADKLDGKESSEFLQNRILSYDSFNSVPLLSGLYGIRSNASDRPSPENTEGKYWTCIMARMGSDTYRYMQIAFYRDSGSVNVYPEMFVRGVAGSDSNPETIETTGNWKEINSSNADTLDGYHATSFARLSSSNTFTGANTFSGTVNLNNNVSFSSGRTVTLNGVTSVVGSISLGGSATATTKSSTDNSTAVATTAFVKTAVSSIDTGIKVVTSDPPSPAVGEMWIRSDLS